MQLVELKNGETYNGHLVNCDTWMNIHLREVICTSKVFCSFIPYSLLFFVGVTHYRTHNHVFAYNDYNPFQIHEGFIGILYVGWR